MENSSERASQRLKERGTEVIGFPIELVKYKVHLKIKKALNDSFK